MLEASVITIDDSGEPTIPYFNKEKVKYYVESYLDNNIKRFTKDYKLTTAYKTSNIKICFSNCRTLEITLNAKINSFFDYKKTQIFKVETRAEI